MTTVMAGASVSLVACDPASGSWDNTPRLNEGAPVEAHTYRTLEACKAADEISDETCEDVYGAGQCVPRGSQGGGVWGPLIAGFVVGRMLDGGYRGTGIYRDGRDGGYYTGFGGRLYSDYATGRTRIGANGIDPPAAIREAPPKVQTRTSVLSRGGFGGRMSAHSYGGGHYGG
jgi:uncharacterized protein YgiB involved in biofilm formation